MSGKAFIARRENLYGLLQSINDTVIKASVNEIDVAKVKKLRVESLVDQFTELIREIIEFNSTVESKDRVKFEQERNAFFDLVDNIELHYLRLCQRVQGQNASQTVIPPATKLKAISIPTFSGKLCEWPQFKSLFDSLVHVSNLPKTQKMQHLMSSLSEEASKLVAHLRLSDANYEVAYDILVDRFENPRRLANHHLNILMKYDVASLSTYVNLQKYYSAHCSSVKAYQALNVPDKLDYLLFHLCYYHLDRSTQVEFDKIYPASSFPTYQILMEFISKMLSTLELHADVAQKPMSKFEPQRKPRMSLLVENKKQLTPLSVRSCPFCKGNHGLLSCERFMELPVQKKYDVLKEFSLCFNCLGNHARFNCRSTGRCRTCNRRHHSILHLERSNLQPFVEPLTAGVASSPDVESSKKTLSCHVETDSKRYSVLLGTARAYLRCGNGHYKPVRVLLDSASEVSCITEACVRRLGLSTQQTNVCLSGISNARSAPLLGKVQCCISPFPNGRRSLKSEALVLSQISAMLPSSPVDYSAAMHFYGIHLADPHFHEPGEVDFLLGANLYPDVLIDRPIVRGKPAGIHTIFGLVLVGEVPSEPTPVVAQTMLAVNSSLESALTKFWQSEEIATACPENPEDVFCEKVFVETTQRNREGRYIVKLPFIIPLLPSGTNRNEAERRFMSLERRLSRDESLKTEYHSFLKEYEALSHMEVATSAADYIIPHHAVFKASSSSTKTRVVFDASAQDSTHMSLNDRLCKGPKLQCDVSHVLSGFRLYVVPLTADLKMMYRQVLVAPEDRIHQHIFWRSSSDVPLQEYELRTLTYGLAPSAFLSQRVLRQLVTDEGREFPLASAILLEQTYVDDLCGGASSEKEATMLYLELHKLLRRGGFFPRKWSSSSNYVLSRIPEEHRETPLLIREEGDISIKVLGLEWNAKKDAFSYSINAFVGDITKRTVLSYVARIFDPLGWLTPYVFSIKYFLQRLWLCGADWDDTLPVELRNEWERFMFDVKELSAIRIPRYVPALVSSDLHVVGFCDGSTKGYGAVLYLRCAYDETVVVELIQGKSKVAPLKTLSVPRLELSGALLLVKMLKSLETFMSRLPPHHVHLYSDSSIVLSWLRTPPHMLKTYVANRVVAITECMPANVWRHVPTAVNPADCASRGLSGSELLSHALWWHGPSFLKEPLSEWPSYVVGPTSVESLPELRPLVPTTLVAKASCTNELFNKIREFSSFGRLTRVFGYVLRFIDNCKLKKAGVVLTKGHLTISELSASEDVCIMLSQREYFCFEINNVKAGKGHSTSLRALAPYLDDRGFLRVGGRLSHSNLSERSKHPILIPKMSHLAKLLCEHFHRTMFHAGPQAMRAQIQLKYWIPGIGSLLRSVVFGCTRCYRFKAETLQPPMADLPASRFTQLRAFLHVGVDYAGPVTIRESRRRKAPTSKVWICVFVCFSTKAMHIEVVSELSTNAFLAALDRFVSRRGLCARIQSDRGTNFTGAAGRLNEVWEFLLASSSAIAENLANRKIEWIFNPPAAPHFNGLNEAAVKSMKFHLYRVVGNHVLTFEELSTLLCRVEAICNSRPLGGYVVKSTQDDVEFLSPGHFLIGSSMLSVPETPLLDVTQNRLCRWQLIQQSIQSFWKQWSSSYLQSLMQRNKWTNPAPTLNVGDVVLLKRTSSSPLNWPLGRIVTLFAGKDGISRVAKVKIGDTILTRPLTSLVRFPAEQ